jgi:hypothetical protein
VFSLLGLLDPYDDRKIFLGKVEIFPIIYLVDKSKIEGATKPNTR